MNKVLFLFCVLCLHVVAMATTLTGDKNEFAGIPFGMDRETVIEEILKVMVEQLKNLMVMIMLVLLI